MIPDRIIDLDRVSVRPEVFNTYFACDLGKCKGACCTLESPYGAPLNPEEVEEIEKALPVVLSNNHLSQFNKNEIKKNGFWEEKQGDLFTRSINNKDCVFVYYEGDVAKCAIERAYFDGKIKYRKPISCHLFPIRISHFGGDIVRYEKFSQCAPALSNGENTKTTIFDFCKDSLIRLYGLSWYTKLKELISK